MDKSINEKISKTISIFEDNMKNIRAGKAHTSLVEGIMVDSYGTPTQLSHLANINTPSNDQITIQPWDASLLLSIEKAIKMSDLGVNPMVDGSIVRINLPPLTQERREEFVKIAKNKAEECRINVRNIRENAMEELEQQLKDKQISEDEKFKTKETVQKQIDEANKKIQDIFNNKESDILNS